MIEYIYIKIWNIQTQILTVHGNYSWKNKKDGGEL